MAEVHTSYRHASMDCVLSARGRISPFRFQPLAMLRDGAVADAQLGGDLAVAGIAATRAARLPDAIRLASAIRGFSDAFRLRIG